jgi:hypothetical protein
MRKILEFILEEFEIFINLIYYRKKEDGFLRLEIHLALMILFLPLFLIYLILVKILN